MTLTYDTTVSELSKRACLKGFFYINILKFGLTMKPRGHKQKKLDNYVYSFLLFVSSGPRYQVEFLCFERNLLVESGLDFIHPAERVMSISLISYIGSLG